MKITTYLIMSMLLLTIVSAASFEAPTTEVKDSYKFRVKAAFEDVDRCLIEGSSADSSDTASFYIYGESGTTGPTKYASALIDTTIMDDASDWIFEGMCTYTDSTTEPIESISNIIVDNTKPVLEVVDFSEDSEWVFNCLGVNTGTVETGGNKYDLIIAGALCKFDPATAPEGDFNVEVKVSDGKDTAALTFVNAVLQEPRDPELLGDFVAEQFKEEEPEKAGMGMIVTIIIITGMLIYINKDGKRKNI